MTRDAFRKRSSIVAPRMGRALRYHLRGRFFLSLEESVLHCGPQSIPHDATAAAVMTNGLWVHFFLLVGLLHLIRMQRMYGKVNCRDKKVAFLLIWHPASVIASGRRRRRREGDRLISEPCLPRGGMQLIMGI